jgi:hypothetical protein
MARLRTLLVLRSLFAAFLIGFGAVLLAGGDTVFGCFAIAFGVTNAALVVVLARRSREPR